MIYQATDEFNVGLGKDVPAMGPFRNYMPKIQGPGSGRIKAVIIGANYVYRYFRKNPRFGARIAAVGGGYGVSRYATSNKYRKTHRAVQSVYNRKRRGKQRRIVKHPCCTICNGRRKRRFSY